MPAFAVLKEPTNILSIMDMFLPKGKTNFQLTLLCFHLEEETSSIWNEQYLFECTEVMMDSKVFFINKYFDYYQDFPRITMTFL